MNGGDRNLIWSEGRKGTLFGTGTGQAKGHIGHTAVVVVHTAMYVCVTVRVGMWLPFGILYGTLGVLGTLFEVK